MYGKMSAPKMAGKQAKMPAAKKPAPRKLPVRGERTMTYKMNKAKK